MPVRSTQRHNLARRLLNACEGKNALSAFFVISAMESSFFPIPIDVAMIPLGIAQKSRIWLVVLVGAFGSVFGSLVGYLVGSLFYTTLGVWIISFYGLEVIVEEFRELFLQNGAMAIFVAGLSPIPFKIAAMLSGSMRMDIFVFLGLTMFVRFLRFSIMGLAILAFGDHLRKIIEQNFSTFAGILLLTMASGFLITPLLL